MGGVGLDGACFFPTALADFLYNTSGRRVLQHHDVALYDDDVHVHAFVDARSLNLARLAASQKDNKGK